MTAQIRLDEAIAKVQERLMRNYDGATVANEYNNGVWSAVSALEALRPSSAPVVDASRVPGVNAPHFVTGLSIATPEAAPAGSNAVMSEVETFMLNRMATPEAGSPAEDDAKLIERLEVAEKVLLLRQAHMTEVEWRAVADVVADASARLRARPQQEGK